MNLLLTLITALWLNPPADTAILDITIKDIRVAKGQIIVKLYQPGNDFMSHDTYKLLIIDPKVPESSTRIVLPQGRYAIALYHDVDMSGRMNKNFIGIPKEPVGISNDAINGLSRPTFEDAAFELIDAKAISIDLEHF